MRIVGGEGRGRKLKSPRGSNTRPTADRVKEAVFNILGNEIIEKSFLDLFGGTGAIAIEAVSRGASRAVVVEWDAQAFKIIKDNIAKLSYIKQIKAIKSDAFLAINHLSKEKDTFHIIYIDPPYYEGLLPKILLEIQNKGVLAENGLLIVETGKKVELADRYLDLHCVKKKNYGDTAILIYTSKAKGEKSWN